MKFLKKYPHIFKIKDEAGQVVGFAPNVQQVKLLEKIEYDLKVKGKSRVIVVKPRQLGFTTLMQLLSLSYVMSEPALNAYTMAHDATIATSIFDQKIKFAFDNLPEKLKSLYKVQRDNIRQLMFEGEMNKATLTVGTSARGTTQNILHISEAGKMSMNQKLWQEMIEGSLPASEQAKIIVIESTADGGKGKFYDMVQNALNDESEFDVFFPSWTDSSKYALEAPKDNAWQNKYIDYATKYRLVMNPLAFGLTLEQWYWYFRQISKLGAGIKSQYPLTLDEAFDQPIEGAYYSDLLDETIANGRYSDRTQYNPNLPVDTYWDLAVNHDLNAVWFIQEDKGQINIIDYWEGTKQSTAEISTQILGKGYMFGRHYAPHDKAKHHLGETANRTAEDLFRAVGIQFSSIGSSNPYSRRLAVRELLPRCNFRACPTVAVGFNHLKNYRSKTNSGGLEVEDHNIDSHGADSFGYLCVNIQLNKSTLNKQTKSTIQRFKQLETI
jgi:hypothetical protein